MKLPLLHSGHITPFLLALCDPFEQNLYEC